jgi:Tfp pilus assembly protein PilE
MIAFMISGASWSNFCARQKQEIQHTKLLQEARSMEHFSNATESPPTERKYHCVDGAEKEEDTSSFQKVAAERIAALKRR